MVFLIKAAQFLLSLSIIVALHELGHFIPARFFKTRVEKFFLFFDIKFALWKKKIGETVYGIGWLPLGGYVKIAGMIDESMDKEQMAKPPEPWEFRSKPAWQRLVIMLGGVVVNLLLGIFLYAMVLWVWGREYLPVQEMKYGLHISDVMKEEGLQDGDLVIAVGGKPLSTLEELNRAILIEDGRDLTVVRNGQEASVTLSADIAERILDSGSKQLFAPRVPFVVDTILPSSSLIGSGVQKGDRIVSINDVETPYFSDFITSVEQLKGKEVRLGIERNGNELVFPVAVNEQGKIGVGNKAPDSYFTFSTETYGFLAAVPAGIEYGLGTLVSYARSLKLLFSSAGIKQVGGFGTIGNLFGASWDWQRFWEMTAFISIILGFMNVLPIPALDGGHAVFIVWEMVTGRPASQRILEVAQVIGFVIIIALVLYANGNDLFKFLQ